MPGVDGGTKLAPVAVALLARVGEALGRGDVALTVQLLATATGVGALFLPPAPVGVEFTPVDGHAVGARAELRDHAVRARLAEHVPAVPRDASLSELIEMADRPISEERERAAHASALAEAVVAAERELVATRRDLEAVEGEWEQWTSAWPERCEHAGLPAGAQPERAQELIRAIKEGLGHVDHIATLETRVAGIDRDNEALFNQVARLCDYVASDLGRPRSRARGRDAQ